MNEYTELELYKIEQAKRILMDAWTDLTQVRPILEAIDAKTEPFDRVQDVLAEYSIFFERCYCK